MDFKEKKSRLSSSALPYCGLDAILSFDRATQMTNMLGSWPSLLVQTSDNLDAYDSVAENVAMLCEFLDVNAGNTPPPHPDNEVSNRDFNEVMLMLSK